MTFFLVCFSHLRSRLTDQGDAYHFGGYADIRVLVNAFLLFTAARFSQSRLERSGDLSVSLSHNASRVLASASISLVLRYEVGSVGAVVFGLADGLLGCLARSVHFVFRMYSRPFFFTAGLAFSVAFAGRAVLVA